MRAMPSMASRVRAALTLVWKTIEKFFIDGCPSMAAALAFYTFFSLPALLSLLLLLVGTIVDPQDVERAITTQVQGLIGRGGADQVRTIIAHVRQTYIDTSVAAVLGAVALFLGATTAFGELVIARLGASGVLLLSANWLVSLAVITEIFAVMFKLLPDAKIAWREVWVGAIGTALLFALGRAVIGYYLGRTDPGSAYGAAGSLAVVMIWVYYSSMIVLSGAEFTRVWTDRVRGGAKPEPGAVEVVEEEVPVQRG